MVGLNFSPCGLYYRSGHENGQFNVHTGHNIWPPWCRRKDSHSQQCRDVYAHVFLSIKMSWLICSGVLSLTLCGADCGFWTSASLNSSARCLWGSVTSDRFASTSHNKSPHVFHVTPQVFLCVQIYLWVTVHQSPGSWRQVCDSCGHFPQMLLFSPPVGAPRVSHPLLLLRDVLVCGWVADSLPQPPAAGLSRLEVGVTWSTSSSLQLSVEFGVTRRCFPTALQVHEPACDELSRTLWPNDHHERRHSGLLSERGLVQTGVLPPLVLLLSLWVTFFC